MRFDWSDTVFRLSVLFLVIVLIYYIIKNVIPFLQGKRCLQLAKNRWGRDSLLNCAKWS